LEAFKLSLLKLQDYTFLVFVLFKGFISNLKYLQDAIKEMYWIGAKAFRLIFLGGLFVGIILAIETGHQLDLFGAKTLVGRTVALGMVRELGPVITGLLLAARTGAKNASEIGAMQLSEQIDALRAFGTSPIQKLVFPRMLAALVMFLPLTLISDMVGIVGGMVVTKFSLGVDTSFFWHSAINSLGLKDIVVGFTKPIFFGFFISTISCYYGFSTTGGTTGLGRNTINAVVVSSMVVLIIDFIFTKLIWALF
jgi:phospholipid/cholesterol/gamma-HCH transport system permease protein